MLIDSVCGNMLHYICMDCQILDEILTGLPYEFITGKKRNYTVGILETVELVIGSISNTVWPVFLPLVMIVGLFLIVRTFTVIQPQTSKPAKVDAAHIVGPAVISLGAMIGTGAIIGVIGSCSKLVAAGQVQIEALAIWALIGSLIMVPVSYAETLIAKVSQQTPKEYIANWLSPKLAMVYAVGFCALHIFGFGGFQFSGIDSVVTIITGEYLDISLSQVQRWLFIVLPLVTAVSLVVLSRKHHIFISAMTYMISIAVGAYIIFFIYFFIKTAGYLPTYLAGMGKGLLNPVNAGLGMPMGFILGIQRVLQSSETGLGTLGMSAREADSQPREAAVVSLLPTCLTIVVSILVTTYITSYGQANGYITLPAEAIERLKGYFVTASAIAGNFGLVVLCIFSLLSGLSVLLSSYYFLSVLFNSKENTNIIIYIIAIFSAGTLAVFGFNIVFDVVDLLLFVVCAINMAALLVFATKKWKDYKLED